MGPPRPPPEFGPGTPRRRRDITTQRPTQRFTAQRPPNANNFERPRTGPDRGHGGPGSALGMCQSLSPIELVAAAQSPPNAPPPNATAQRPKPTTSDSDGICGERTLRRRQGGPEVLDRPTSPSPRNRHPTLRHPTPRPNAHPTPTTQRQILQTPPSALKSRRGTDNGYRDPPSKFRPVGPRCQRPTVTQRSATQHLDPTPA